MTAVLTKTAIDAAIAKIGKGQRVVLNDDREAGLFIRIGERGAKWGVHPCDIAKPARQLPRERRRP